MDYLTQFKKTSDSLVYKLNMSNLTVQKSVDELSLANKQRDIGYLFQDDMIKYMTQALSENQEKEVELETNNTDSGIEDFAPYKDFNKLLSSWTEYGNLCSQFLDLYEEYQDDASNLSTAILDADIIKQKMKDKVVLALNG